MDYPFIKVRKYYDALRTNTPFFKAPFLNKKKIIKNILIFLKDRKKIVIDNKPVTAQIEPTSCCNLKCDFCIREKIGVPIGTMNFNDFKIILDKLDCLFKIHLSGQGEPFLNKDIFKMIEYANKRGILVNLNTNGTILNKEIIDRLCNVEVGEIAISIESTKPSEYEKLRRGAKFNDVMNNITELIYALNNKKKKTIVSFAITLLRDNINEIYSFINLAKKIGIKKLVVQTIQKKEDYIKNYKEKAKEQIISDTQEKINIKLREAKKIAEKNNVSFIFDEQESPGCIWPWRAIYVTWNGYITPCCKILNYQKPIIGNLLQDNLSKIWNGKYFQMFRRMLKQRKAPYACKGCNMV